MKSHVIISGTGKAGTTALVKILTLAGFDTGYTKAQVERANLEKGALEYANPKNRWREGMPEILKTPHFCDYLQEDIDNGMKVRACIVPIRDLSLVAASSVNRGNSLDGDVENTKNRNAVKFHRLMLTCARNRIPVHFLPYAEWTEEDRWLNGVVGKIYPKPGSVPWGRLQDAWREVCG